MAGREVEKFQLFQARPLSKFVSWDSVTLYSHRSSDSTSDDEVSEEQSQQIQQEISRVEGKLESTPVCGSCGCSFEKKPDQRDHYKSDWHRYNVKRKLRNLESLSETEFSDLVSKDSDLSSISGSEDEEEATSRNHIEPIFIPKSSKCHFMIRKSDTILSVNRCILATRKEDITEELLVNRIRNLLQRESIKSLVVMMAGGHFAAAVFDNSTVSAHKTFHKYTVRAKQGTSQSANDARGSKAKSAGANLRRYCEASMKESIEELFKSWQNLLTKVDLVFVRATGSNASLLFSGKSSVLSKYSEKIRTIPFPTKRPTFSEIKRVHTLIFELTETPRPVFESKFVQRKSSPISSPQKVDISQSGMSEDALEDIKSSVEIDSIVFRGDNEQHSKSLEDPSQEEAKTPEFQHEDLTNCKNEEVSTEPTLLQKFADVYCESSEVCLQFLEENVEELRSAVFPDGDSLLHFFSVQNDVDLITWCLDHDFDPTVKDARNRPPCACVTDKHARNAFRRFRGRHPHRYDYKSAQIPDPILEESEKEKAAKLAEKRKEARARKKAKEKEEKKAKFLTDIENKQKADFLKLSDREKRALTAEKRLGKCYRCFMCGNQIENLIPFKYEDFDFCSTDCVYQHRKSRASSN